MTYQEIKINIDWTGVDDERIGPNHYAPSDNTSDKVLIQPHDASAMQMVALFANVQIAYEAICAGLEYPMHNIYVSRVSHPNMSFSLKGLGEPILALKEVLEAVPGLIVSLCTIRSEIEKKKSENRREIVLNETAVRLIKDATAGYKKAHPSDRAAVLRESLKYQAKENPEIIRKTELGGSEVIIRIVEDFEESQAKASQQPHAQGPSAEMA